MSRRQAFNLLTATTVVDELVQTTREAPRQRPENLRKVIQCGTNGGGLSCRSSRWRGLPHSQSQRLKLLLARCSHLDYRSRPSRLAADDSWGNRQRLAATGSTAA